MPFPGYMQDLSQLIEDKDCLIPVSSSIESKLSSSDLTSSAIATRDSPTTTDLSSSIWDDLLLLNGASSFTAAGDEKARIESEARLTDPFTSGSLEQANNIWDLPGATLSQLIPPSHSNSLSVGQQQLLGLLMETLQDTAPSPTQSPPTTMDPSIEDEITSTATSPPSSKHHPSAMNFQREKSDLHAASPMMLATPSHIPTLQINGVHNPSAAQVSIPPVALFSMPDPNADAPVPASAILKAAQDAGCAPASALNFTPTATALATRTTEDVIADLKRNKQYSFASPEPKRRQGSYANVQTSTTSEQGSSRQVPSEIAKLAIHGPDAEEEGFEHEEEEDDDTLPTSKPRKITERKRKLNAVAEAHMQKRLESLTKEATKSRVQDQQSTRWLVKQAEKREIISNPREYQVELFNRAVEKNIIAVLDTGQYPSLLVKLHC